LILLSVDRDGGGEDEHEADAAAVMVDDMRSCLAGRSLQAVDLRFRSRRSSYLGEVIFPAGWLLTTSRSSL